MISIFFEYRIKCLISVSKFFFPLTSWLIFNLCLKSSVKGSTNLIPKSDTKTVTSKSELK